MAAPVVFHRGLPVAVLGLVEASVPPLVACLSLYVVTALYGVPFDTLYQELAALVLILSAALLRLPRSATPELPASRLQLAFSLAFRWGMLLGVLLAIGFATKISTEYSRLAIFTWALVTPPFLLLAGLIMRAHARRVLSDPDMARRAVIVGYNQSSLTLAKRLKMDSSSGLRVQCFFDDRGADRLGVSEEVQLQGRLTELIEYVHRHAIEVIFVALPVGNIGRVRQVLEALRDTTVSVYYVPDIQVYDLIQARSGELLGVPVVALYETPFSGDRGAAKRLFDLIACGLGLLIALPVMLVIAALIKATSKGPAIFRQRRYGLDGQEITVYKFRTMRVTEDGPEIHQATLGDPRVTPLGRFLRKTSLDELPQLINVIQGRMSLVGPRPHAIAHNEMYRKLISGYMIRHKVPPGITGLAQVHGMRGETRTVEQMEARVRYDLEYLRHWSLLLDIKILVKTLLLVFRDPKAY